MPLKLLKSPYHASKRTSICGNCLDLYRAVDHVSFGGSFQCPSTIVSLTSPSGTIMHLHLLISTAWICGICHLIRYFKGFLIRSFLVDDSRTSSDLQALNMGETDLSRGV